MRGIDPECDTVDPCLSGGGLVHVADKTGDHVKVKDGIVAPEGESVVSRERSEVGEVARSSSRSGSSSSISDGGGGARCRGAGRVRMRPSGVVCAANSREGEEACGEDVVHIGFRGCVDDCSYIGGDHDARVLIYF